MIVFNENQFDKVGHALGINLCHCKKSKFKKDKLLPEEFYRNYYCYGRPGDEEPEWMQGIEDFINKWEQFGSLYFQVNEKGIKLFRSQFKAEITDTYVPVRKSKNILLEQKK